jgi:hypothetical protein
MLIYFVDLIQECMKEYFKTKFQGEVDWLQHFVIKFVRDLGQYNETDRHNITEILLKVALNTINQPTQPTIQYLNLLLLKSHPYF